MSVRVFYPAELASRTVVGSGSLGVLGSVIRGTTATGDHGPGYLYNDWDSTADDNKEFVGEIITFPTSGVFFARNDGSFTLTGAPDGNYSFTYRLRVDGADLGTATATISIGSLVSVSAEYSQAYNVRALTSNTTTQAYNLRAGVVSPTVQAYAIRSQVVRTVSQAYAISSSVINTVGQAYNIQSLVFREIPQAYLIDTGIPKIQVISEYSQAYTLKSFVVRTINQAYELKDSALVGLQPHFDRTARSLILKYGTTWNYTQVQPALYDVNTSEATPIIETVPVKIVLMDLTLQSNGYSAKYGTEILAGDKEGYMLPTLKTTGLPIKITPGADYITANGIRYTVITFKEVNPTGLDPIVYFLYLRR